MRLSMLYVLLTLLPASVLPAGDVIEPKPGRWETTVKIDFGAQKLPEGMPLGAPVTETNCLTAADVKKAASFVPPPEANCKVSDYKRIGNDISYGLKCEDTEIAAKVTLLSAESFRGVFTTQGKDLPQKLVMNIAGRRIGDVCTKEDLAEASASE